MLAYLRYAVIALIALVLVTLALANRAIVTVQLMPDALASLTGFNLGVTLPLFLVLGLAIAAGLMIGFVWEWMREHSYRAEAGRARREIEHLRAELDRVQKQAPQTRKDDVLALIEAN